MAEPRKWDWRIRLAIAVIVAGIWAIMTPAFVMIAGFSVMASDAPGSGSNPGVLAFIYGCWSLPVLALLAGVIGIVGAVKSRASWIVWSSALPIIVFGLAWSALATAPLFQRAG